MTNLFRDERDREALRYWFREHGANTDAEQERLIRSALKFCPKAGVDGLTGREAALVLTALKDAQS